MKLRAFAKINFSLRVFGRRPDGFHNIESVLQSISLHDVITLEPLASRIEITCNDPAVPLGRKNLVYKAAALFSTGVRIHIEKQIPIAAGLAGGSADAAAVLCGLNQIRDRESRITNHDLLALGAQVGSDLPFCLIGGTCLVKGRGEIVEKLEPWPKTYFVLVCPDLQISSRWAYEEFDKLHLNVSGQVKNDLEQAVVAKYDLVTVIKEKLLQLGCSEAQMSGSGPSVFGVAKDKTQAEKIVKEIKFNYPKTFMVETVERGVEEL